MKKILGLTFVIVGALTLGACDGDERAARAAINNRILEQGIADRIVDYGVVDGCSVKWVVTVRHPSFWLVRCPNSTTTTEYDTGGKSPTRVGATTN